MKRWLMLAGFLQCWGFQQYQRPLAHRVRRDATRLKDTTQSDAPVVCVGSGPVFLLAAKTAASMGHPTTIVTTQEQLYRQLLWGDEEPLSTLRMLGVTSDEDALAFESAVADATGVLICFDKAEQTLNDNLLNVVLPPSQRTRRVVMLSRHLNGKGNGLLCAAAKGTANTDVWAATPATVEICRSFEQKVRAKANESSATDVVIVRAGTLKGGGPGDAASVVEKANSYVPTLSYGFYRQGQQDLVNWRLLFDCDTNGVELTPGDSAEGPAWKAILAATSPEAEKGDSGRVGVAQAMVRTLSIAGLSGKEFGVQTKQSRLPPSDEDWNAMLSNVLSKLSQT